MNDYHHIPVLLNEVIKYLDPKPGENFVDATLGGGGYSQAILKRILPKGKLLAIDLDTEAITNFETNLKSQISNQESVILVHDNFRNIDKIVEKHKIKGVDGIVADIGLSSYQLDQSGRGITFQKKELLNMRFDASVEQVDAKFILNNYSYQELEKIFKEFGEEKFSRQIAKKIIEFRSKNSELRYTTDLYQVIEQALPKPVKHKAADSARRIFQALRISVNHELDNLRELLEKGFDLLAPGGKMGIVTFHSLEDRIVKHYFKELTKGCICPIDFPKCVCGKNPQGRLVTKKPVTASAEEIKNNSRAKPAKLRVIQKI